MARNLTSLEMTEEAKEAVKAKYGSIAMFFQSTIGREFGLEFVRDSHKSAIKLLLKEEKED